MATNRPKRVHEATAKWRGRWYRAECSCGWKSVDQLDEATAEREAVAHVARAKGA